ncbi:tetratricopeptide repeat protein [Brachyspira murdochii]|uniref:TPR repeat-containing protein n=2 Tax=Brachyspira TaxID=29521 RepID=D5U9K0_BRAM5|nr:tetratricopeptide repeat protein [Brachyspira murdochii]ADG71373.1 TPR repeat-containing protein [Brachyspira murdochii DSM 12563]
MTEELKAKIQKLILEENYEEAIKLCDEAIEKDDKDEDAYFNMAFAKINLQRYKEAIEGYSKVIELNNKNEIAYINRSVCYEINKQYKEAISDLDNVIKLNQYNEKAYFYRGIDKNFIGLYEDAINDFSIAISIINSYRNSYSNIDFSSMLKSYSNLNNIILDNNFLQALGENAKKFIFNKINIYNKLLDTKNIYILSFYNRALTKMFLQLNKEAFDDFNIVIQLNPTFFEAYFSRGLLKSNLAMDKEAIEDYKKVIELNPKYIDAYINIAISNSILYGYDKAMEYFDKAISINKNYSSIYLNRGMIKAFYNKYTESIEDFNTAIQISSDNPIIYFYKSKSLYNLRLYNESIENAEKAINLYNKYMNAHYVKILSKAKLKKYIEFIDDLKNVAAINPDFSNNFITDIMNLLETYSNIETIFQLLIENENIILWKNEPITNLISRFEESKNFDDKLKENIKYLLLYEYLLLKLLTFDTEEENNNIEISHYTSLDILQLLLNVKENTKESGNIRINNITTANDPKEGKILESILNKNNIYIKIENDEKALTLQTSYSRNKDSLTMFRLYGKKENKEATGVCLVLDNKYFNNSYTSPYSYEFKLKIENNKISINEKINKEKLQENKRNLYWVLYYNEKENQIIYNKEKSKYASNIIDLNDLNNDDYKLELKEDDKKEDMIKYAFAKIFYYTREIKKQIENQKNNEIYKNIKSQLYSYLFENIKYIIKHEAFFEEQELRMLVTNDYKSDEILIDNDNKKLYIDYIKLFNENTNYIKEIIIGSKVENNEAVAEYIRKLLHLKNTEDNKLDDIKVSISEAPLR